MSSGRRTIRKNNVSAVSVYDIDSGFAKQLQNNEVAMDELLSKMADAVYENAKSTALFADKTGNLRRSIKKYKSRYPKGGYIVYAGAPHAHLIEYGRAKRGGGRVAPRPFMRRALARGKTYASSIINQAKVG